MMLLICAKTMTLSLGPEFYNEMSTLLRDELDSGKVLFTDSQPTCVHSLGTVTKSNGKLRPITDCSHPEDYSTNNFMDSTYNSPITQWMTLSKYFIKVTSYQ